MTDTINTLADPGSDPAHEWQQPDAVNHPGHYTSHPSGVECIQVTEHMSFCLGNAIKYIWRADLKGNAIKDLQKARWYVDREIARLGGEPADLDRLAADGRLLPEGGTAGMSRMQAEFARASARMERLPDEYRPVVTPPAASVPLELPTEPGSRIRASVKRWGSAREWADTDPYVDTFTLGERDIWHAENDCLVVGAWNREYITVLEVLPAASVPDGGPDGTPEKPWPNPVGGE
ncbi:hypothetical protein B0F70_24355 [Rhodococcus hoagii]|uniref:DUF3310 domain-containing protein n=1 Tax=Rhodococcus hoagii TaxID=43767 RepID=UPI001ADDB559|nr:DUF3310 domain-containing protein [Prescottella equi]MBP0080138.1 hypothetical protein [Prescottella equi]